jgi:hypothetical protein
MPSCPRRNRAGKVGLLRYTSENIDVNPGVILPCGIFRSFVRRVNQMPAAINQIEVYLFRLKSRYLMPRCRVPKARRFAFRKTIMWMMDHRWDQYLLSLAANGRSLLFSQIAH